MTAVSPSPTRERRGPVGGPLPAVLAAGLAIVALGWFLLVRTPLASVTPFVQFVSFTQYLVPVVALAPVIALAVRRWRLAVAALLAAGLLTSTVLPRALPDGPGSGDLAGAAAVRVLSVNMMLGRADAARVVELVRTERIDVLSVQELTEGAVQRLDAAGLADLLPERALRPLYGALGTGIYSRLPIDSPGLLSGATTFEQATANVRVGDTTVAVVAVHPAPPLPDGGVRRWRRDFAALPPAGDGPVRLLAGDFNATLDHRVFRELISTGYVDAGDRTGRGLIPTWPSDGQGLPPITIDHILVSEGTGVSDYRVHDVAGTDHRAVSVELAVGPAVGRPGTGRP